jgi:Nucleotidyl transferase AbiEii toxin, Type IV TA system
MAMRGLEIGFLLDCQWHALRGEMEATKRPALIALARLLGDAHTPYAIVDGIALQIHQAEPRTTLDIDLVVSSFEAIPRDELHAAGFDLSGQFAHSENWLDPEGVPVQFTDDPALGPAIERAVEIDLAGVPLRVIGRADLLHEKLHAGSDPAGRRSKRLQDLVDAHALLEEAPELRSALSESERAILAALPE